MSFKLRPYQKEAIQSLYDYYGQHKGNPVLVLPTGAVDTWFRPHSFGMCWRNIRTNGCCS